MPTNSDLEPILITAGGLLIAFWIWMFLDCVIREKESGPKITWLIVILIGGIIGAPVYFFVRKPRRKEGQVQSQTASVGVSESTIPKSVVENQQVIFAFTGIIIGSAIAYFLRPSAVLGGQLPFIVVVTRGESLEGLDKILVPMAQTSFNYLIAGSILGGLGGFAAGTFTKKK